MLVARLGSWEAAVGWATIPCPAVPGLTAPPEHGADLMRPDSALGGGWFRVRAAHG